MLPRNQPDRIRIVFDDHRLVANAGLLLPATLARHLGLRELVDHHLDLGGAPGRANTGDKLMTLVASAMAGGDSTTLVLRTWGTACTLGGTVKAPSTLGTFLRSFRWGHVRNQLDRVSRELLARCLGRWAGPGDAPFDHRPRFHHLRDLRTGQGGRPPPRLYRQAGLPPTAGHRRRHRRRADVPAARGPGQHRPRRRPLPAGDGQDGWLRRGQRTTHAYGPTAGSTLMAWYPSAGWMSASPSPSASTRACAISSRRYPMDAWTPIPYWMDGAADVAETHLHSLPE